MLHDRETRQRATRYRPGVMIDGMVYDGLDPSAAWRAHVRELTMARQAAEQRYAKLTRAFEFGKPAQSAEVRPQARALQAELARISAEHWVWLHEHGLDVADRPQRARRSDDASRQ